MAGRRVKLLTITEKTGEEREKSESENDQIPGT